MTPAQWARVFKAGHEAIVANRFRMAERDDALTPELWPVAAARWSLIAMQAECERIAEEER